MKVFIKSIYFTLFVALINVPFIAYVVSDNYTTFDIERFIMIELLYSSIVFSFNYLLFKFTNICTKSKIKNFFIALIVGLFIWTFNFAMLHVIDTGDVFWYSLVSSLTLFMPVAMIGYYGWVFILLYILGFTLICGMNENGEEKGLKLLKKVLKIIFFGILFIILALGAFLYFILTADDSEYSTTSPSGKYEFTIYESCFFYCEQSAQIYRIEDDTTQFCHLGLHSKAPIFNDGVTFSWSEDERKVRWNASGNSGTIDIQKDTKNNRNFFSPSSKNLISITQRCILEDGCKYTFSYVKERYDRSTSRDENICPIIDNKKAEKLFGKSEEDFNWSIDEQSVSFLHDGKLEKIDLYQECILGGYKPKRFDLSETSFEIFEKHKSNIPEAAFEDVGFYPLGTSKDGKFAYMTRYLTGSSGIFYLVTRVIDLYTNKIVYKDEFETPENNPKNITIQSYWEQNRDKIVENLKSFNINLIPTNHFTFSENIQNYRWIYSVDKNMTKNLVESYKVFLSADHSIKREIDARNYKMPSHLLDVNVVGHFAVGYDYFAVIVGEVLEGYEGAPHEISYHVVGVVLGR